MTATLTTTSPNTTTNDNTNVNVNVTAAPAGAHLTDLSGRRMAIVRIWDAMFRGARSYVARQGRAPRGARRCLPS